MPLPICGILLISCIPHVHSLHCTIAQGPSAALLKCARKLSGLLGGFLTPRLVGDLVAAGEALEGVIIPALVGAISVGPTAEAGRVGAVSGAHAAWRRLRRQVTLDLRTELSTLPLLEALRSAVGLVQALLEPDSDHVFWLCYFAGCFYGCFS